MAIGQIPPWLAPGDFLGAAQSGAKIGLEREQIASQAAQSFARISAERARLDQVAQESALNSKIAQERMDRDFRIKEQENAIQEAYNIQRLGLEEKQLEAVAKKEAQTIAAKKSVADSKAFMDIGKNPVMLGEESAMMGKMNSGVPALQAVGEHPTMLQNEPFKSKWLPVFKSETSRREHPGKRGALEELMAGESGQAAIPEEIPIPDFEASMPVPDADTVFENEEDARSAGNENGDIVIIKGFGKVRLK